MTQALLAGFLVLVVPGYTLLVCLPERFDLPAPARRDFLSRLADSVALSVALTAFFGLVGMLTGIRYTIPGLVVIYALCILILLISWIRSVRRLLAYTFTSYLLVAASLLACAASIFWRVYQARELALPAWVDSVHHVLIVRKIMEYGGVPWDLLPYVDAPFYYHYGFHLVTALFSSLAGWNASQSVLWFGQVMNACVALSVYRLGMALGPVETCGSEQEYSMVRLRASIAALLVGFAMQMPAYYLTWGRYTLLTGLLLLAPAMAAAYEIFNKTQAHLPSSYLPPDWGAAIRYVVLLTGIFMTHYLAALLVALFLVVLGLSGLWQGAVQRTWRAFPWVLVVGGLLSIVLSAPWLWHLMNYNAAHAQVSLVVPQAASAGQTTSREYLNYLVYLLGPRHNYYLMGIAAVGMFFGLRRAVLRPLAVWTFGVLLLSSPWGVRIGPFRPDLYVIVLFLPAAFFLAELLVSSSQAVALLWRPTAGPVVLAMASLLLLGWGAWQTRTVINRATVFVTPADVAALDWVNQNLPPGARFYTNVVAWQYHIYRGVDGGFWLAPYTGRASMVPPVIYGYSSPEKVKTITELARRAEQITGCTQDFWDLVRDASLTHVYLRQGTGKLQPQMLETCTELLKVYSAGGINIYEITAP